MRLFNQAVTNSATQNIANENMFKKAFEVFSIERLRLSRENSSNLTDSLVKLISTAHYQSSAKPYVLRHALYEASIKEFAASYISAVETIILQHCDPIADDQLELLKLDFRKIFEFKLEYAKNATSRFFASQGLPGNAETGLSPLQSMFGDVHRNYQDILVSTIKQSNLQRTYEKEAKSTKSKENIYQQYVAYFHNKKWVSVAIIIFVPLAALITFLANIQPAWNFVQDFSKPDTNITISREQLHAQQFRPRLTLSRNPHIKEVKNEFQGFNPESLRILASRLDSSDRLFKLDSKIRIISQLFLKNTGNVLAKVFGYVQTDTTSFIPIIRESFLKSLHAKDSVLIEELNSVNEILPGDSTVLTFEHEVAFIDSHKFTLHYLILYENELGNLYDTYIWNKFEVNDIPMKMEFAEVDTQQFMRIIHPRMKASDIVVPSGPPNDSYYAYEKSDAENVHQLFKALRDRKKNREIPALRSEQRD